MYRFARRAVPFLAAGVIAVGAGSCVFAAQPVPARDAAAFFASLLCSPTAAMQAADDYINGGEAIPVAQTYDENDYSSGFWTQLPTQSEIVPPQSSAASQAEPEPVPEGMCPLYAAHYDVYAQGCVNSGAGYVRNCTDWSDADVSAEMMQQLPFDIQLNSAEPQVLIMHTHATETYELEDKSWCDPEFTARSTDVSINMVSVGKEMAAVLNAAGINTVQDATLHDYPSYTGSYANSNATVRKWLAEHPSIKVVLDVHRDAIQQEDGTRIKPIAEIEGQQTAQVMLICGCDVDGNIPNCRQNLRFASRWQNAMQALYPGLARPALFDYRYYNQDLTTGSLLIEVGGHANTLDEATKAGVYAAKALAALFRGEV
ncbi:MAG: stage II sporulation protein P [Ruminococcaceae bacterium]|nr:stage II sporulation protein P [Oscillospiraceae bacterium]